MKSFIILTTFFINQSLWSCLLFIWLDHSFLILDSDFCTGIALKLDSCGPAMHSIQFSNDNASFLTTFGEDAKVFTPISHLGALTNISHQLQSLVQQRQAIN